MWKFINILSGHPSARLRHLEALHFGLEDASENWIDSWATYTLISRQRLNIRLVYFPAAARRTKPKMTGWGDWKNCSRLPLHWLGSGDGRNSCFHSLLCTLPTTYKLKFTLLTAFWLTCYKCDDFLPFPKLVFAHSSDQIQ